MEGFRKREWVFLVIFSFLLFSGCEKFFPSKKPQTSTETRPEEEPFQISGPLLAQVNNWKLGLDDFERKVNALKDLAKAQGKEIEVNFDYKNNLLNELVKAALLSEEAKLRGLDKENDVKEQLETFKQSLLAQKLVEEETKFLNVTEAEIENFYKQNKEYFKKPDQLKIREIVVNSEAEAKSIYIRLLQGENFASLASQFSVAESRGRGGDLGYLDYDPEKKFPRFWEMAFALNKGEISSIFKDEKGKCYIIKVEDKKEGGYTPLSEVRDKIKQALEAQRKAKKIDELVNSARQKFKVVINQDLLR